MDKGFDVLSGGKLMRVADEEAWSLIPESPTKNQNSRTTKNKGLALPVLLPFSNFCYRLNECIYDELEDVSVLGSRFSQRHGSLL